MKNISRRKFVKTSALGATALAFSSKSYARIIGANERVNFAIAVIRSRGGANMAAALACNNTHIAALVDVDSRTFKDKQAELFMRGQDSPATFKDIRKVLESKDIDAITIATPDHWHAPMAIMAMQAGKHVYLEKPASHNPQEGEWLVETQRKTGKVIQIGNQQRSAITSIQAVKEIRNGLIGKPYYGKAWYSNTRGSIGFGKPAPVPEWLDWDLFQGPAPRKEFKDNIVHYNWHWFWNWGTGEINNNALHELDICRWALGVGLPKRVKSSGGRYHFKDDWEFYDTQIANYEYDKDVMIAWEGKCCNGKKFYDRGRGAIIHGTKGSIILTRNGYELFDLQGNLIKKENENEKSATTDLKGIGGLDVYHMQNFLDAIRKGTKLNSPVDEAHISTLMCHLGNIAQKHQKVLNIDPSNGHILKNKKAMKMWGRKYEKGWKPEV